MRKHASVIWSATLSAVLTSLPAVTVAAELKPQTVAAFDRYVQAAEAEMNAPGEFLWLDRHGGSERESSLASVRGGQLRIERLETRNGGKKIDVPSGLIHHWIGLVFAPGASVDQAVQLLQAYDSHTTLFSPAVAKSRLLSRDDDVFRVYLRFTMKKVITVVVDTENEARFTRLAPDRARSRIYSLRVNEVEDANTPRERLNPVGNDGGYLWRLYTYWRFLERDGGTYVECESISLTRGIPMGLGWVIGPFVTSIPRESLTFTLERTRKTLERQLHAGR